MIKTIRMVQPDLVMVELCPSRISILSMDEQTLLREAKDLNSQKILQTIKQAGDNCLIIDLRKKNYQVCLRGCFSQELFKGYCTSYFFQCPLISPESCQWLQVESFELLTSKKISLYTCLFMNKNS